jgi:hypothetical protein
VYAAWTLWQLGYPDQALKRGNEAFALSQSLVHPFSLAVAQSFLGFLDQFRREARGAHENAASVIALCAEHGFTQILAYTTILFAWAMAEQGLTQERLAQIQEGLAGSRATGAEVLRPYLLCLLAEAHEDGPRRRRARRFDRSTGRRRRERKLCL